MKKYRYKTNLYRSILILFLGYGNSHAVDFQRYPELVRVVQTMVQQDGYPQAELDAILQGAAINPAIITAMNNQYEKRPWHEYRQLFINRARIQRGVAYWNQHAAALQRAAQEYGVPPSIIVALLGVETDFGTRLGKQRVLDALVTLTAEYSRRNRYFGGELRAFLNIARAENIAPHSVVGSFAGAVGIPQFMPTSYQAYAVDFNGNARRDLVNESEDAIGSVANYLKRHGWVAGQVIFAPVVGQIPPPAAELVSKHAKPSVTAAQLHASGVDFAAHGGSEKMALLQLQEASGKRYLVGFNNLYALTRYNSSVNYAMAVAELAHQIDRQRAP